jgi:SAM-dependent methyltransferase
LKPLNLDGKAVTTRYRFAPLLSRAYLAVRLRNLPYKRLEGLFDSLSGNVVSIGAGYGLYEIMIAAANPRVRFLASDLNPERVRLASLATRDLPNIQFAVVDLTRETPPEPANTYLLFDVLHHLPPLAQVSTLRSLAERLEPGGRIIIKECGTRPMWKMWVNYLNDAIGTPFQRTYPRSETEWAKMLESFGLSAHTARFDQGCPYAHVLVVGTRPEL